MAPRYIFGTSRKWTPTHPAHSQPCFHAQWLCASFKVLPWLLRVTDICRKAPFKHLKSMPLLTNAFGRPRSRERRETPDNSHQYELTWGKKDIQMAERKKQRRPGNFATDQPVDWCACNLGLPLFLVPVVVNLRWVSAEGTVLLQEPTILHADPLLWYARLQDICSGAWANLIWTPSKHHVFCASTQFPCTAGCSLGGAATFIL